MTIQRTDLLLAVAVLIASCQSPEQCQDAQVQPLPEAGVDVVVTVDDHRFLDFSMLGVPWTIHSAWSERRELWTLDAKPDLPDGKYTGLVS